MGNPVIGTCACPLCSDDGAEVREGVKGRLYIVCDGCVSMTTTMSRQGRALIANRLPKPAADPAPQPAPAPAPRKTKADAKPAAPAAPSVAPAPKPVEKPATLGFFGL